MNIIAIAIGIGLGAGMFWLVQIWRQRSSPATLPDTPAEIRFLIEDGQVIDESEAAKRLLGDENPIDWPVLVDLLAPRFPDFPPSYENALNRLPFTIHPMNGDDSAQLSLSPIADRLSLRIEQPTCASLTAEHHVARIDQISLGMMTRAVGHAPFPVWICDETDQMIWHNPAYARALDGRIDHEALDFTQEPKCRIQADTAPDQDDRWFEVSRQQVDNLTAYFAVDISRLAHAERAQRGFVQTLTKTFANLGTGLAIFNRHHKLVLFNPALIDLTQMSAEFLTSRPSLTAFFDWLRDNRVMPEPRDYGEWRVKLRALTKEATEGTFSELWSLPNGLSFRVLGRPQTDGAVAFLFEDVTAELSLSRNFIKELEINNALLNRLPQAIAIFSPTGDILSVNAQYHALWGQSHNTQITLVDVPSAVAIWSAMCKPTDIWDDITRALNASSGSGSSRRQALLLDGRNVTIAVERLGKGAAAVLFNVNAEIPAEIQAVLA